MNKLRSGQVKLIYLNPCYFRNVINWDICLNPFVRDYVDFVISVILSLQPLNICGDENKYVFLFVSLFLLVLIVVATQGPTKVLTNSMFLFLGKVD